MLAHFTRIDFKNFQFRTPTVLVMLGRLEMMEHPWN